MQKCDNCPFFGKFMKALQSQSVDLSLCSSLQMPPHLGFLCYGVCGQLPLTRVLEPRVLEPSITVSPSLPPPYCVGCSGKWLLSPITDTLTPCSTLNPFQHWSYTMFLLGSPNGVFYTVTLFSQAHCCLRSFLRCFLLFTVISLFLEPSIGPIGLWSGIHSPHLLPESPFITFLQAASYLLTVSFQFCGLYCLPVFS